MQVTCYRGSIALPSKSGKLLEFDDLHSFFSYNKMYFPQLIKQILQKEKDIKMHTHFYLVFFFNDILLVYAVKKIFIIIIIMLKFELLSDGEKILKLC